MTFNLKDRPRVCNECHPSGEKKETMSGVSATISPKDFAACYTHSINLSDINSVIAELEKEELTFAQSRGQTPRSLADCISTHTTLRFPFFFNDFDPTTKDDDQILLQTYGFIQIIRRKLSEKGLKEGSYQLTKELADKLIDYVKQENGIGIKRGEVVTQEMTLIEFLKQPKGNRKGDCTEFSRLALAIFRLAGLNPKLVYVTKNKFEPAVTEHMAIVVALNPDKPTELTTIDLHYDFISTQRHAEQSEMSFLTALAVYANSRAGHAFLPKTEECSMDEAEKAHIEGLLQQAIRYDSNYAPAHHNYAFFLDKCRIDKKIEACSEAETAHKIRPSNMEFGKLFGSLCQPTLDGGK